MSKRVAKRRKEIPRFANEDQERRFWAKEDTADYFDWDKAVQPTLPALKADDDGDFSSVASGDAGGLEEFG